MLQFSSIMGFALCACSFSSLCMADESPREMASTSECEACVSKKMLRDEELVLMQSSASSGDVAAQFKLGEIIYYGYGLEQNKTKGLEWYQRAADGGHAEAQYVLSGIFLNDETKSLKWLERSALSGYARAQCELGVMLYCGVGIKKNEAKGIEWLERASTNGQPEAQTILANIYHGYHGIRKNQAEVDLACYNQAVASGNAGAQYLLGCSYYVGIGSEKNEARGIELLKLAAERGHVAAKDWLEVIALKHKK